MRTFAPRSDVPSKDKPFYHPPGAERGWRPCVSDRHQVTDAKGRSDHATDDRRHVRAL